jgi:hypothetical protein
VIVVGRSGVIVVRRKDVIVEAGRGFGALVSVF